MRRFHFAGHECPAGLGQHAAQQRGAGLGEYPGGLPQAGVARRRQTGAERTEMLAALGDQRAEHGQHQAEVLDEHRRILDALAEQRPQPDFEQRDEQHQGQRRAGDQGIEGSQTAPHRPGRRCAHQRWPARKAFRWPTTSSKVSAGTILPRTRG